MNIVKYILIALLFCSSTASATPASEDSIKQLLTVTHAQKLLDSMQSQFNSLMNNATQQALKGKAPTPKQQQAIDNMQNKMITLMKGQLSWEKIEPMYLHLYRESFSAEEVDSMLSFYKTPGGQAVINKMPGLMQKTMLEVQRLLGGISPQMQKIQQDFISEMKAASK